MSSTRSIQTMMAVVLIVFAAIYASVQVQFVMPHSIHQLIIWMPFILQGFFINLVMSALAMLLGTVLGLGLGLLELSHIVTVRKPAYFIMNLFRNTPWLVILFIAMYVFPFEFTWINGEVIAIPGWIPAIFSFAIAVMPDIAEVLRGAVNSIPKAQWESAESLGLTRRQTLKVIILPQCMRSMIPPWMNWYAILTLATPLASILGVNEALRNTSIAMEAAGSNPEYLIPFYLFLLALFFLYIYPISLMTRRLERKYGFIN